MPRLTVTDHALVRFLERAGGLDLEALRRDLATSLDRSVRAAEKIGSGDYIVKADGLDYVIRNGCLVSVIPATDGRRV